LSQAIAQSRAIISLLGPGSERQPRTVFADWYRRIIPMMQKHGVRRLFALATNAIRRSDDQFSVSRALTSGLIRVIANNGYQSILAIQEYFESVDDLKIEWTVFRVGMLSGTSEAAAWSTDREQGEAYAGPVGATGYTLGINRSVLARWLVNEALEQEPRWAHQMPAVSNRG
jgi:hypothetical protein